MFTSAIRAEDVMIKAVTEGAFFADNHDHQ